MSSCAELVHLAVELRDEAAGFYTEASKRIEKPGLRSLVLSVAEHEQDQAAALRELARRGNFESLFAELNAPGSPDQFRVRRRAGEPLELLRSMITEIDQSVELYEQIRTAAKDPDVRDRLGRLVQERRRVRAMVESRYDLEQLGGGV